jgi:hypothetical protein
MTTQYNIDPNIQGVNGFGLPFCTQIYSSTLAAGVDTLLAVPATAAIGMPSSNVFNKWVAVFSYARHTPADAVFVAVNAVAAVPAGAPFALTTSEIEPPAKHCKTGDTIHFFCVGVADVTVAFYAVQD